MAIPSSDPQQPRPHAAVPAAGDSSIQPFLEPDFDPVDYLNRTLPSLATSTTSARGIKTVPLAELTSPLQTLLSQLNAQTSRLSNTLTQLTDEIIRSGSRLAYEVEVLRGETLGLKDTLENDLKKDIDVFAIQSTNDNGGADTVQDTTAEEPNKSPETEPEYLERLRTLTTIRERLDAVIKTFGSAMQWPIAPSELSLTSSLISVSAPDSNDESRSREEVGQQFAERLRQEINDLLTTGTEGLEAADARIAELRDLAEVWRGTAEEKARLKQVDALQKLVDDKRKSLDKPNGDGGRKAAALPVRGHDLRYGSADSSRLQPEAGSGYGFLQNLRNLT
ncbi:unnamed protein product [Zymoseptoria tritici ST99CH_3D7]|uniref:Uncharacterized protein n=1 Tax=Zymoseptoria tritici (strain ST99CH_3D7) TaxID=1276538 RepID=A0A1X7RD34_ZYMT9|nr:unnamed protein product [Zymoseptoria tritici ST99CH_3D7]